MGARLCWLVVVVWWDEKNQLRALPLSLSLSLSFSFLFVVSMFDLDQRIDVKVNLFLPCVSEWICTFVLVVECVSPFCFVVVQ